MVSTPAETAREDEMPISPTPDSSVPDIFSTKKIFFLNSSYSGSRRSEIPHIEADYCPRDEVSRRLFHHTNNSCDCDCASDGCWGCIRRNRQCFCKVFVLVLSILLIILLFGSLSYNLTRNKDTDESLESDQKTEWASHDHQFSTSDTKDNFLETGQSKSNLKLPISLYETLPEDDNSGGDFQKVQYSVVELGPNLNQEDIEPLAFKPLDSSKFEPTLLIYDAREPHRRKRSISPRNKKLEIDLLNKHKDKFDKGVKKKSVQQESINFQQNLETYKKTFNQKAHTVFQPFSLTTPAYSTPLESYEYSLEENDLEEELKLRFLNPDLKNFESQEKIKSEGDVGENFSESKNSEKENEKTEKTTNYDLIGRYVEDNLINELLGISTKPRSDVEVPRNGDAKFYSFTDEDLIPTTEYFQLMKESHSTKGYTKEYIAAVTKEAKLLLEEVSEVDEKHASENTTLIDNQDFRGSDLEYRTFSNLFQMAVPFAELFGINHHENSNQNHEETDRVKGISLAEAKEQKKERRKHLLLNSRVVGGSSDVRLPTGPDVSKPFINAVETLKTNQQLSFMPSATSQYILPYQMCFFANPVPGLKPSFHVGQPRTFPLRPSSLYPTAVDSAPKQHTPSQQNFLSFNINNFANGPPMRQIPSGSSVFNFPPLQQNPFLNVPGSSRQPIFCTNLQPPLFQFPTVPGTADFSHAKCTDCDEETYKHGLSGKENFFSPAASRDTICADNSIPCRDGSNCIPVNHWCDNQVQCKDASDEAFCSCRERISKEKLCDGYIDCPHGEDEIGCFNCPKSAFTCDNIVSPGSCIPLSKRCDGVRDCASGVDESECSALFFNVRFNDTFSVSQMKGFLHRNWKGDWFPVCVEIRDNAWAREACFGELGFLPQDLHVTFVPVPNHYKGPFIVRQEDGTPTLQDHCKGHISTYVKCPAMSCGTRVEFPNMQEFESRFRRFILNYSNGSKSNSTAGSTNSIPQPKIIKNVVRPKREETGRVVGGRESEPRAWPWAIALYKDGAFHCGGVILDEKWVLTAAHCLEQYWKHFYEVRGGMLRRFSFSAMEQVRTVTHAIIHESYNPAIMNNDIAVLRLKEPFQFNRWVRPACLPSLQDGLSKFLWGPVPGTRCIAVGWGALRERGYDPDQLREVEIPIMRRCKHKEDLAGAEICAGKAEGGKDTCQGDSGGPLLCRDSGIPSSWYVAGIVSHGEGCARPGEPGAYTRISLFVDWITANTNDFQLPTVKPLSSCPGLRCRSGSKLCLPIKWVCNGFTDCLEAEDEKNCSTRFVISEIFNEQYEGGPKSMEKKIELGVIKDDVSTLKKSTPISTVMLTTEAIPEEKLKKNEKVSFVESGKNSKKWEKAIEVLPSLKNKDALSLIIEEQLGETTNKSEEEKKFSTENPIANLKNGPLTTEMFVKSSELSNVSEVLNMSVKQKTTDGHFTYQTKEVEVLTTQTTKKITEVEEANNSEESVAQNLWSTVEKNEGEMGYSKTLLATETANSDIRLGDKLTTNDKNVDILNQVSEKTTEPSITILGTFKPSENKMDFTQEIEDKIVFQKINSVATTTNRNNVLAIEDAKTFKTITDEAFQVVKSTVDMKDHSISSEDETESSFISEDKDLDELEKEEAEDKILTIEDDKTPTGSNDTNGSWMGDKDSKSQESEEESKEEEYKDILNTSNILTKVYESTSESLLKSPPVEFYQKERFKETTIKALSNEIDEISSNKVEHITTEFQPLSSLFVTYDSEERTLGVYEKTEVATSAEKFFENYLPGTKKHVMEYENFKATTSMEEEPKIGTNFYIAKEEAEKKSQIAFTTESIQSLDIETENKGNVKIEKDWLKYEELEVTTPKPLQQSSNPQTISYIRKQITENESENKLTTESLKISDAKTKTESYNAEKAIASTDYLEEFEIGENISLGAQKIVKLTEAITEGQLNSDFSSEKNFVENDWFEATRTTNENQEKEKKKNFQNIHISKITESEKEAKTITIPLATTLRTNGEEFEIEYNQSAQHTLPEETVTPHVIQTRATGNTDQESSTHAGLKNQAVKAARRPALNSGANYYQCKIIVQSILASYRCDGVIDCEDGTDEENCECAKTLTPELVCDGHVDCPDYSDEKNCSLCSKKEFHCQISQTCISLRERCDGVAQCKFGEDESDCFTLVKNPDVNAPPDRETFLSTKGVLMSNKNGVWSIECQEGGAILDAGHAIEVCASLGTIGYDKYQNKTLGMNCTGFEVTCAESLISFLEKYGSSEEGYFWPWHSLVYSDGAPLCSAVLLKPQWLLAPKRCVEKVTLQQNYLSARLGTKTPLAKIEKKPSKFIFIDAIEPVHDSDMVLLHLSQKVNQTKFIRPIGIPYLFESDSQKDVCVAVGDKTVFLKIENCSPTSRCYNKRNLKSLNCKSKPWMGVIVCQSRLGWYPSSVFVEEAGDCGFRHVKFTAVQEKLDAIHLALTRQVKAFPLPNCHGFWCPEGICVPYNKTCNGWPDCPSKKDEDFNMCRRMKKWRKECKITELRCKMGSCVPKTVFADGIEDCEDNSDEPTNATCLEYLRLTAPHRICDGRRNCYDKTDEDPELCPCDGFKFQCKSSHKCVPKDFVCDGEKDCPDGEDEDRCVGRKTVKNHTRSHLEIMQKSFGVWHTICPTSMTKDRSDALCRELGFEEALFTYERNQTVLTPKIDSFSWVKLNQRTSLALRGDKPFVGLVKLKKICTAVKCA